MRPSRHSFPLLCLLLLLSLFWRGASADGDLTLGVLSQLPLEDGQARWQPLADHLNREMPEHRVKVRAFNYPGLERAIQQNRIDFLLTHPTHYLKLQSQKALAGTLATLVEQVAGEPLPAIGGVIFTRADNDGVSQLSDLRRGAIASCAKACMEGYQLQLEMFLDAGLAPPEEEQMLFLGMPHDNVVEAVLEGQADAGFVRAGVLERLAGEGRLDLSGIKIIHRQALTGFPYAVSTRLYPQWPVVALPHVEEASARRMAAALLGIEGDMALSRSIGIHGFTIPANYTAVDNLARKLRLAPYDTLPHLTLSDIWASYRWTIVSLTLTGMVILILLLGIWLSHREMKAAQRQGEQQRQALDISYTHLRTLVETIPDLIWLKDKEGFFLSCNRQFERLFGAPESEIIGKTDYDFVPEELAAFFRQKDKEAMLADQPCVNEEWVTYAEDGRKALLETIKTPMRGSEGEVIGVLGMARDITQRREDEDRLRFFQRVLESAGEAFMVTDTKGVIVSVNPAFTSITGYEASEILGKTPAVLKSGRQDRVFYQKMWAAIAKEGCWAGEIWDRRKDGDIYPKWLNISTVKNELGEATHYVAAFSDITDRKAAEEQIHSLAFFDPLTNLPNRRLFMDRIGHALLAGKRSKKYGALLLMDLDNFKTLNDTQGHAVGDRLLIEVGNRLVNSIREVDTVSRLGGDEFVVLFEELDEAESAAATHAEIMAEKIRYQINQPYSLEDTARSYQTTASIGLTLFMGQDLSIDALLKQADLALYQAKDAGRDAIRFFNPAMQAAIESHAAMESALRKGLAEDELSLVYQPLVNEAGSCIGAEALLRWNSREQGPISPVDFIPLAEETGLIMPVGDWVFKTACRQLKEWQGDPATQGLSLSVNISAYQFRQPDFVEWMEEIISAIAVDPHYLKIELTESAVLYDVDEAVVRMSRVKALGIGLSLDDFGTGYSSLSYLKRLPVEQVKIDRSFVDDLPDDLNDAAIVRAILSMSESLGLSVVAEGVEEESQFAYLKQYGCPVFQGYLFGRPMPSTAFRAYLERPA